MYEVLLVDTAQRFQDLPGNVHTVAPRQRPRVKALSQGERVGQFRGHRHPAFDRHGGIERQDVRVGKAGADPHLAKEALRRVGIVAGGARQRPHALHAFGEGVLHPVLHRAARTPDDVENPVTGVRAPEFELHPAGLLAGPGPRGGVATGHDIPPGAPGKIEYSCRETQSETLPESSILGWGYSSVNLPIDSRQGNTKG